MKLLKAIGKMLACFVIGLAAIAVLSGGSTAWFEFANKFHGVWGFVVFMAPLVAVMAVVVTRQFYKEQP